MPLFLTIKWSLKNLKLKIWIFFILNKRNSKIIMYSECKSWLWFFSRQCYKVFALIEWAHPKEFDKWINYSQKPIMIQMKTFRSKIFICVNKRIKLYKDFKLNLKKEKFNFFRLICSSNFDIIYCSDHELGAHRAKQSSCVKKRFWFPAHPP